MISSKHPKINDLEINLAKVEIARKNNTTPDCWEIGKQTIAFLQRMKVIKYREAREIYSKILEAPKHAKLYFYLLKMEHSSDVEYIIVKYIVEIDPFVNIFIWPMKESNHVVEKQKYISSISEGNSKIRKGYEKYINYLNEEYKYLKPLNEWLFKEFYAGTLEKSIERYLSKSQKTVSQKSVFPKIVAKKLSGKRCRPEEIIPTFSVEEIDVLHVAFHKSQTMTEKELEIRQRLDQHANKETDTHVKVVIGRAEALNMCYIEGSRSGERRLKFFTAAESLSKKVVTWVIDKEDGGYILHKEPVARIAFAYELSKEKIEEGRYFCLEIPKKLLNQMKGNYIKEQKYGRLALRSVPPRLSAAQDRFIFKLKGVAPINKKSERIWKWDAKKWVEEVFGRDPDHYSRNLDSLEEFGNKQAILGFLESFQRVEESSVIFFKFIFPKYCKFN